MSLLESPSMRQRRSTFSCGESRGAAASSVATRIGSRFRTVAAASTRWGRLASIMNDRNACGKIKMQRGDTSDRPQWVVRRHTDRGCLSHSSDLLGLHKSAHMTDVGLNDVHGGARAENVVEFEA